MGVNYNSDREVIEMLNNCEDLGIKYAKFQLFTKNMVSKELQHCYIDKKRAEKFYRAGKRRGIKILFSVMYSEAIDICESIGVNYYKIRYLDRNNLILYRRLKQIKDFKKKTIFVSCDNPQETIFWNISKYQKNIRFLYCIPKYPTTYHRYKKAFWTKNIDGISDHSKDLRLFEYCKEIGYPWFEMHVKLGDNCYESKWSKSFEELKEVLSYER